MNNFHVYVVQIESSGIFYIGSTSQIDKRLKRHLNELKNNTHHNSVFQSAWNNSDKKLIINTIELPDRTKAYELEQKMIDSAINGPRSHLLANIGTGVDGGDNLTRNPDKDIIVDRIVNSIKKRYSEMSKEEKITKHGLPGSRNGMYGKTHSVEARRLISLAHKGHSYNKGCKLSEQHIEKIRSRQKLRTGEKNSFFGRHHSEETKRKLREKNLGKRNWSLKISAENIIFNSFKDAAKHFNISQGLVTHRVKSEKYPSWFKLSAV